MAPHADHRIGDLLIQNQALVATHGTMISAQWLLAHATQATAAFRHAFAGTQMMRRYRRVEEVGFAGP